MKKVRLVVMMLVFILGISGCSFSDANDYDSVRDISDTIIYVDFETNVMYAWCKRGYGGGFSVMLNPDGLPKLYDKATSKYTNIRDISDTIIYVDFETNVMYAWCKRGYGGGFSVMLNPDGLPKLYDKLHQYIPMYVILMIQMFMLILKQMSCMLGVGEDMEEDFP